MCNAASSFLEYSPIEVDKVVNSKKFKLIDELLANFRSFKLGFDDFDEFEMDEVYYILKAIFNDYRYIIEFFGKFSSFWECLPKLNKRLVSDESFKELNELIKAVFQCERSSFFTLNSSKDALVSRAASVLKKPIIISKNMGLVGAAFTERKPVVVDDAYQDSRFDKYYDSKNNFRTRNVLCWPVISSVTKECLGVVQAINKKGYEKFNNEDFLIAKSLSEIIGFNLDEFLGTIDIQKHKTKLKKFIIEVGIVYRQITHIEAIRSMIDMINCLVSGGNCRIVKKTDEYQIFESDKEWQRSKALGIVGKVFDSGIVKIVGDTKHDRDFNPLFDIESPFPLFTLPVKVGIEIVAVIQFDYPQNLCSILGSIDPLDEAIINCFEDVFVEILTKFFEF